MLQSHSTGPEHTPRRCDFCRSEAVSNRRDFLKRCGAGFGMLGLAGLLESHGMLANAETAAPGLLQPHFPGKAKSVIFLFMYGGPSAVDLFDYKPDLDKHDGKKLDWKG